ncbi:MAG: deoxyribose-phosphate aldolase [Candidatus Caldatribacterium sp.]|uniref:deoxyribose-phosphate aldolase n=1 Tax=Candidatus Caldatribacterium sp. TaxID=2282143 RepID=UPI002996CD36|nr:deoxyribose-phosphate aldolase [Candidatus Caldatribacterium sp.]MCX7731050.1 deoxyribose-phosphate aldolase [Candidatus Caldatribacterium sp.]MDW8081221.1 deoxyribose-phosphate aldolase [Candidatus Calescibacterium sp.]
MEDFWKLREKVEEALGVEIPVRERFPEREEIPEGEENLTVFLARHTDITLLHPAATREDIRKLCEDAKRWGFFSVIVNPYYVALCSELLEGSGVLVGVAVGFPLGQNKPEVKAREARLAFQEGAREADMVVNLAALKSGDWKVVYQDIRGVVEEMSPCRVKVVLEAGYLTREEKVVGCLIAQAARAHFVKTSTGFGPSGATEEDVRLFREVVGSSLGVKAAGGIKTRTQALALLKAGANRLGTSTVGILTSEAPQAPDQLQR